MSIAVNQVSSVVAAQGVAGDVAFQPGSVIAARVVKILPDNQVRISIGDLAIDVQSDVPLQPGQILQLAVSQTSDGIRLAVVSQQGNTPQGGVPDEAALSLAALGTLFDNVTLSPDVPVATTAAAPRIVLTPTETAAVSTAAQVAVTQQAGLSSLFADLGAAASSQTLPPPLQQAVTQLLAQRQVLDTKLTGEEVQAAFRNSGLFLESSLASGAVLRSQTTPDLKAALLVFRQLLSTSLAGAVSEPAGVVSPPVTAQAASASVSTSPSPLVASTSTASPPTIAGSLAPEADGAHPVQQQTTPAVPQATVSPDGAAEIAVPRSPAVAGQHAATTTALLSLLQDVAGRLAPGEASRTNENPAEPLLPDVLQAIASQTRPREEPGIARTNIPPPPVRGALPSAQPVAQPTLAPDAPLPNTVKHLLTDTDAAIARQTLMQVASLPDRADITSARLDPTAPRWNFEIPFAMPQGTAVAQFEISRDGGNDRDAETTNKVWRARFSLDIEPAGPVHALVTLSGDRTSVRMWAERPATAQQLRAGAGQLGLALVRADLKPGDIVIQQGAPPQPAPAPAGHFLDRAL